MTATAAKRAATMTTRTTTRSNHACVSRLVFVPSLRTAPTYRAVCVVTAQPKKKHNHKHHNCAHHPHDASGDDDHQHHHHETGDLLP